MKEEYIWHNHAKRKLFCGCNSSWSRSETLSSKVGFPSSMYRCLNCGLFPWFFPKKSDERKFLASL